MAIGLRAWWLGILRYIRKTQPDLDMATLRSESMRSKPYESSRPRPSSHMSRLPIACSSVDDLSLDLRRIQDPRCASRTQKTCNNCTISAHFVYQLYIHCIPYTNFTFHKSLPVLAYMLQALAYLVQFYSEFANHTRRQPASHAGDSFVDN
jgi:hypothetical protein